MPEIDRVLSQACDSRTVPGVVAIAATGDGILYEGAFGVRDMGTGQPMTLDSVFLFASMTKAVTSAAAMQLVEQGRLSLDEPIGRLLPDLAAPQVLEGFDESGSPKLRPARTAITLRQLMTHTAGFAYDFFSAKLQRYAQHTGLPNIFTCKNEALRTPVMAEPGETWEYGTSIDFVGKAVEAASGQRLDAYLREHMFAPLAMKDTGFKLDDDKKARLATVHARLDDGSFKPMSFLVEQEPEFHMGGGGLYGTGHDYIRFIRMILNGGSLDGHQVLRRETVRMMAENHIGALNVPPMKSTVAAYSRDVHLFPEQDKKWGLSFLINTQKTVEGRSPGSLAWAGLANTYFWIDPTRNVGGVALMQILPFADEGALGTFAAFERGVYARLDQAQQAA